MTTLIESILPDPDLGIDQLTRTEDASCAYCGDRLGKRHWVIDLITGYLGEASARGSLTYVSLESQLRAHCCTEHAALDLDSYLGAYGIQRSKLGSSRIVPCGRCGALVDRREEHHSIWAAEIHDDRDHSFEQHCHAVICPVCVDQLGAPDGDDDPDGGESLLDGAVLLAA